MGLIVDDNGKGIHGELRRESFSVFSDFAKAWDVELDLELLDEFFLVVRRLKDARDSGMHYDAHRRFAKRKELAPRRARELAEMEGSAKVVQKLESWTRTVSPELRPELEQFIDDLRSSLEMPHFLRQHWSVTKLEKNYLKIRLEALMQARNTVCPGCNKGRPHYGCRAFRLRVMIGRLDPRLERLTPKDWAPAPKA